MVQTFTFEKTNILDTLKANREAHRGIFLEALDGYQKHAVRTFKDNIEAIKKGKLVQYVSIPLPVDHTKDYDRIISLLELSKGNDIELTEQQFASYIRDDWEWKKTFLASNSFYSATAASQTDDED